VAVVDRDGQAIIVNASRPATLVAFEDAHPGKQMPSSIREVAWVVHHALGIEQPLDEWLATLEDISAVPEDVELARRVLGGDERARRQALGEIPRDEPDEPEQGEEVNGRPPDPALEQAEAGIGGGSSRA